MTILNDPSRVDEFRKAVPELAFCRALGPRLTSGGGRFSLLRGAGGA